MRIAQDRAKQTRRVTLAFHRLARSADVLRTAGLGDAQLAQLASWVLQLQVAFERMANTKEYRCCRSHAHVTSMPFQEQPTAVQYQGTRVVISSDAVWLQDAARHSFDVKMLCDAPDTHLLWAILCISA